MPEEITDKEETKGLKLGEKLDVIIDALTKKEEKKFRLPIFMQLFGKAQMKKGFCVVIFVRTNGQIEIKMVRVENNTIKIGDVIYAASADYIMRWKRFSVMIVPEWTMVPFSPAENFKSASTEGTLTAAEVLVASRMKTDAIKPKLNFDIKWLLIAAVVIGGGYFLLKYFKLI